MKPRESGRLIPSSSLGQSMESMSTSSTSITTTNEQSKSSEILKSGIMMGGFAPNKGRNKSYYIVLSERALEIHESLKSFNKKKPVKHTIDLSTAFNVGQSTLDPKKSPLYVCIVCPDDTLLLKAEKDEDTVKWYESILATTVPARAVRLGRPVHPLEFFEVVFDVVISQTPKSVPDKNVDICPNILKKIPDLEGPRRICFYAHTIVIAKRKIEPAKPELCPPEGIPPFKTDDFLELQRKFVPSFGFREKFFILMMGRGSPMGQCELWAECESKQYAANVHNSLNVIIDRESQKKMKMNGGSFSSPPTPALPNPSSIHNRGHRERSHTQPHRQRLPTESLPGASTLTSISSPGGISTTSESARDRRIQLRESKGMDSFDEEGTSYNRQHRTSSILLDLSTRRNTVNPLAHLTRKASTGSPLVGGGGGGLGGLSSLLSTPKGSNTPKGSIDSLSYQSSIQSQSHSTLPIPGTRHSFTLPSTSSSSSPTTNNGGGLSSIFPPTRRQSETIKEETSTYQAMDAFIQDDEWMNREGRDRIDKRRKSPSTTSVDETEDSGGTLRIGNDSKNPTPNGSIRNLSITRTQPEPHLQSKEVSSEEDDVISAGTNTSTGGSLSTADESCYAQMEAAEWSGDSTTHLAVPSMKEYTLEEARSYVSSSSDSCYSSMAVAGTSNCTVSNMMGGGGNGMNNHSYRTSSFGGVYPSMQRPLGGQSSTLPYDNLIPSECIDRSSGGGGGGTIDSSPDTNIYTSSTAEEARKRAFSLGSKNFLVSFSRPFRKFSQHSARTRHSATSASGVSLASSTVSSGPPPSSASSNHIANLVGSTTSTDKDDAYHRNRSGSFTSGRSTPHSRKSGQIDKSRDHLVEVDFGGGTSHHGGLGRCGSGSVGSVDSPSRSRTSSFGCQMQIKSEKGDSESECGMTPSQILLQKARQSSVDDYDSSDYVLTDPTAASSSPLIAPRKSSSSIPSNTILSTNIPSSIMTSSPDHVLYTTTPTTTAALDLMSKSHDCRNSQYFETIEETTSGRSSRASSVDGGVHRGGGGRDEDDEYTLMEIGNMSMKEGMGSVSSQLITPSSSSSIPVYPTPRSRSVSPCRAVGGNSSNGTIHSQSSTCESLKPLRPKMSTQSEGPSLSHLTAPSIPKRSSVPVLKDQAEPTKDESNLNYAFLQLNTSSDSSSSSRNRSKSGIVFAGKEEDDDHVEYSLLKPC